MISQQSIAQLRDVPLYDIVHPHYTKLKRSGRGYTGCCPFHNEKTPSFNVNSAKNIYKCFGCGEGGNDAITFLRKAKNLDFIEAAELLSDLAGIPLERDEKFDQHAYEQKKAERKSLQQLIDECSARYSAQLWQKDCPGMDYLKADRGYDEDTIQYWGLGYAPNADNALVRHYFSSGALPELAKLSLVKEFGTGDEVRSIDFFNGRVLFPIANERGETVSFGGRIIGRSASKGDPKYLNTAGTDLYDKSRTLYGLYQAVKGIKELKFATLTEGYTDVIGLHRSGLNNAVATCGTALTPDQCQLLKRHTDRVLLMRDGDEAGRKATSRDLPLLIKHGFAVDIMPLAQGIDPDDFAKQFIS